MRKAAVIYVLFLVLETLGQSQPEPKQVDEFGKVTCEDISARTDSFYQQLSYEPTARGLVIINPEAGKAYLANAQWKRILTRFQFGRSENRISFILGEDKPSIQTSFWIVPVGAPEPKVTGHRWVEPTLDVTKPFIFGYEDEIGICPTFVPRLYAELLTEHRAAKGHIVIYGQTSADRRTFARNWLDKFRDDFGLRKTKFRVFFVKQRGITGAEFWFVPNKP